MLAGKAEAALAMAARERALELGHPIVFDPNIRLGALGRQPRPRGRGLRRVRAGRVPREVQPGRGAAHDRRDHPEEAAASLLAAGAEHVIVTLGARGAILRATGCGATWRRVVTVLSTVGAGDVFVGVVLARARHDGLLPGGDRGRAARGREEAARACERWGALE